MHCSNEEYLHSLPSIFFFVLMLLEAVSRPRGQREMSSDCSAIIGHCQLPRDLLLIRGCFPKEARFGATFQHGKAEQIVLPPTSRSAA